MRWMLCAFAQHRWILVQHPTGLVLLCDRCGIREA
jgi:hypothetical protein